MSNITRFALSSTAAVALLAGASSLSANAAPLGTNLESLKAAAPAASETVQWRHRHRGRNVAIGLGAFGAGLVVGSAIANNQGYYYDQPYGYYGPAYGYYEGPYGYYSPSGNQVGTDDDLADVAR
ncbi:MAG: hypothetical protein KF835_11100 [Xanthobacteraceae bacterium]|nr:hypothetical protein [Xanthobacteraceae bacterium]